MFAPEELYPFDWTKCLLTIFDMRVPGAAERFSRERGAWREHGDVEMIDLEHPVLIVWPGVAREVA